MQKEEIVRYYDQCQIDYSIFWDLNHSRAMHAGYWDETTRSLREALKRENEILAERARISKKDRVLDAGCGVGGSSLFLAQNYGCNVVGISLSDKQVEQASFMAQKAKIYPLPEFKVADYTWTGFQGSSFDVVWAIESVCHARNKEDFVMEAARLLRPGGRLILADGFALKEHALMDKWMKGWGVPSLETAEGFIAMLKRHGFTNIEFQDATPHVIPSAKRLYLYSLFGIPMSKIGEWVGLRTSVQTENLRSARYHYEALKQNLWQYGIVSAERTV